MPLTPLVVAFVAVLATTGCASRPRQIALEATPVDRASLVGSWEGVYRIEGRRGGIIDFRLATGDGQAFGDVLMVPEGAGQPYRRSPPGQGKGPAAVPTSEVLNITFVRAEDGRLTGALTPYWDPERTCLATATFRGALDGGTMTGTFASTCQGGPPTYLGRWTMRRKVPAARR